jgi:hypothetical protein
MNFEEAKNIFIENFHQTENWEKRESLGGEFIQSYGSEAAKVWLRVALEKGEEFELYNLEEANDSCPWKKYVNTPITETINQIFSPIKHEIPSFIEKFSELTITFLAMYYEERWYLLYFTYVPRRLKNLSWEEAKIKIFVGGEPNKSPINENITEIPHELKLLYQVHDGFGEMEYSNLGIFHNYVLPSYWLEYWMDSNVWIDEFSDIIPFPIDQCILIYYSFSLDRQFYDVRNSSTFTWGIKEHEVYGKGTPFFVFFSDIFIDAI